MKDVLSGTCSREQYQGYLCGMQALVESLLRSPALPRDNTFLADALQMRAAWLGQDLRAMGLARTGLMSTKWKSDAHLWGAAYVVEGSALGARVLHRQLLARADLHAALRALQGWGDSAGEHWQAFVTQLEQRPMDDAPVMQQAACQAFEALHKRFSQSMSSIISDNTSG